MVSGGLRDTDLVPRPLLVSPVLERGSLVNSSGGCAGFTPDRTAGATEERFQSLIKASGLDMPASGMLLAHRLSPRLAAKNWGAKKSSVRKAQDLKCKKLKMVRFASEVDRSASMSALSVSTLERSLPSYSMPSGSPPPSTPKAISCPEAVSSPRTDFLSPLTLAETKIIKAACGIISGPGDGASNSEGLTAGM